MALLRAGASPQNVAALAGTIVASERDGVRSHGLLRLRGFVHSIKIGWADGQARPRIVSEAPGLLVVDAQNGFAQTALAHVRSKLAGMARSNGTAVLLTRNSHHFAALWPDIEEFAAEGFVALTCVNSKKRMAAWEGRRPVTGTNAMAFACPRTGHLPLVWDQSSSVMSQGDVLLAASKGHDVPLGVGCDANGEPTTSSSAILNGGALLPFGGNKGASIAVMIEILAAALTGGPFAFEDESPAQTATTSKGGTVLAHHRSGPRQHCLRRTDFFFVCRRYRCGRAALAGRSSPRSAPQDTERRPSYRRRDVCITAPARELRRAERGRLSANDRRSSLARAPSRHFLPRPPLQDLEVYGAEVRCGGALERSRPDWALATGRLSTVPANRRIILSGS